MKVSDTEVVVQPRTRIPEPPVQIPFQTVLRITPESTSGTNLAKAIGIGAAAAVGATLGVFAILAAIFAD